MFQISLFAEFFFLFNSAAITPELIKFHRAEKKIVIVVTGMT